MRVDSVIRDTSKQPQEQGLFTQRLSNRYQNMLDTRFINASLVMRISFTLFGANNLKLFSYFLWVLSIQEGGGEKPEERSSCSRSNTRRREETPFVESRPERPRQ